MKTGIPPKLQKGAILLHKPIKKKVGGWVGMSYDAEFYYLGMRWLRVQGGMGEHHDCEDWVADIPGVSISVHDYHWNGEWFGANHGSFIGAIVAKTKDALRRATDRHQELLGQAAEQAKAVERIRAALELMK